MWKNPRMFNFWLTLFWLQFSLNLVCLQRVSVVESCVWLCHNLNIRANHDGKLQKVGWQ